LAFAALGLEAQICDPTEVALSGYWAVYQSLDRDRDQ
jgi:hypothetical protein